ALLFPIDWPEPFGMVMIEALACGTPVIAYPHGSVPEIISQGMNGFIVSSVEEAINALDLVDLLDKKLIRTNFETRFSSKMMATNYVRNYKKLISKNITYLNTKAEQAKDQAKLI